MVTLIQSCTGVNSPSTGLQSTPKLSNCRAVRHSMGETCVPINPKRVIVLDTSPLDAMFELGLKPVAAPELGEFFTYSTDQLAGIKSVGNAYQPNLETLLQLQPDLILANYLNTPEIYAALSKIAPTVVAIKDDTAWKEELKIYAAALNKETEAEALLQAYAERIQEFQQSMGDRLAETEVSIVSFADYGPGRPIRIYLPDSFMGSVVEEAGLPRPPGQRDRTWTKDLSMERLDIADGDVIFSMEFEPEENLLSKVQQHPLWTQLNAVKLGHVYPVNYATWVAERNIGGANRVLDDLFEYLVNSEE